MAYYLSIIYNKSKMALISLLQRKIPNFDALPSYTKNNSIIYKYKNLNIDTHVLKCKIINRNENFKSMTNIYREMLIAWMDLELSHHMKSIQQIYHKTRKQAS